MNDFEAIEQAATEPENHFKAVQLYREITGKPALKSIAAVEQFQKTVDWNPTDSISSYHYEDIENLVLDGEMIPAIRMYQEITEMSLQESVHAIQKVQDYFLYTGEREHKIEIFYEHDGESETLRTSNRNQSPEQMATFNRKFNFLFPLMFFGIFGTVIAFISFVFGLLFYLGKFE